MQVHQKSLHHEQRCARGQAQRQDTGHAGHLKSFVVFDGVFSMLSFVNFHVLTEAPGRMGIGVAILVFAVTQLTTPMALYTRLGQTLTATQIDGLFRAIVAGVTAALLFAYKKKHVSTAVKSTPQTVVNPTP